MLRRFLYLNSSTLSDYVSALEGGMRESLERTKIAERNAQAGVKVSVVEAGVGGSRGAEETVSLSDTPQSQFHRLMELAAAQPDLAGWVDVVNPDVDFNGIGIGALIDIECDVYVPEMIRALSPEGGIADVLDQLEAIMPFAQSMDPNAAQGMPSQDQRDAMRAMSGFIGSKGLIVGDLDASTWRVAGQIETEYVMGDLEGPVRVTGKVANQWRTGQWKPLLALPGSSLIPRERRRSLERTRPQSGQEDQYLEGPALMLDILAVYR